MRLVPRWHRHPVDDHESYNTPFQPFAFTLFLAEAFGGFARGKAAVGVCDEDDVFVAGYESAEASPDGGNVAVEVLVRWDSAHRGEVEKNYGVSVRFEDGCYAGIDGGFVPCSGDHYYSWFPGHDENILRVSLLGRGLYRR